MVGKVVGTGLVCMVWVLLTPVSGQGAIVARGECTNCSPVGGSSIRANCVYDSQCERIDGLPVKTTDGTPYEERTSAICDNCPPTSCPPREGSPPCNPKTCPLSLTITFTEEYSWSLTPSISVGDEGPIKFSLAGAVGGHFANMTYSVTQGCNPTAAPCSKLKESLVLRVYTNVKAKITHQFKLSWKCTSTPTASGTAAECEAAAQSAVWGDEETCDTKESTVTAKVYNGQAECKTTWTGNCDQSPP